MAGSCELPAILPFKGVFLFHPGSMPARIKKCALCAHSAPSAVAARQHLPRARVRINVFFDTIGNEISYRTKKDASLRKRPDDCDIAY